MNTINTFLASVMFFVSSLFGHITPTQIITTTPIETIGQTSITKKDTEVNTKTSIETKPQAENLIKNLRGLLYSCNGDDSWMKEQCKMTTEALQSMDVSTLQELRGYYYVDKDRVYISVNGVETAYITILKNANPASFEVLNEKYRLSKDKNSVFVGENRIEGINAPTFHLIGTTSLMYAKDSQKVYSIIFSERDNSLITLKEIKGVDPEKFIVQNK